MDFNKIIEKHGYSEEMGDFLNKIYNEFVLNFGPEYEKIIYMAFYEVSIISVSNIYDGLIENDLYVPNDGSIVNDGDLKRASGCYTSRATEKLENGTYVIDKINRKVLINNLDLSQNWIKGVLIHELGHLVKSYVNEYHINSNLKTNRSGLIENTVKIENLGKYSLVSEKGVGLEEGLNTILERDVAYKLVDEDYKISGYSVICAVAEKFLELTYKDTLYRAQLYGQKADLISWFNQKYGDSAYQKFESMADKIYLLELEMYSHIFEPEKMQESSSKLQNVINNEYWPLIDELLAFEKNSGGRNA